MDSDIEVLETSEESPLITVVEYTPRSSQSIFTPAPPALCRRWTQPSQVLNPPVARGPPHWTQPANRGGQHSSIPIISNVVSLSPQKNQPVISKVESLSPSRQISRPQLPIGSHFLNSFFQMPRISNPVTATSIRHVNPLRNGSVSNGFIRPSPFGPLNQRGVKRKRARNEISVNSRLQPKLQPECIVLDDDDDVNCDDSTSSKIAKLENNTTSGKEVVTRELQNKKDVDCIKVDTESSASLEDAIITEHADNATSPEPAERGCREEENAQETTDAIVKPIVTPLFKKRIKPVPVKEDKVTIDDFIKACTVADNSSDMRIILEKKVRKYYTNCNSSFTSSSSFCDILRKILLKVENDKSNVYVHITELVDELKARKGHGNQESKDGGGPAKKKRKGEPSKVDYEAVEEARNADKIKKLNKTLSKLQKMIKELEAKEVDWEDEDNSTYMMLQRYKARAVKVFNKLCDYTKESKSVTMNKIHFSGTKFPQVNKCVERFINQTGQFPDYVDILDLIKKVNEDEDFKMTEGQIENIAKEAFKEVGEELQNQRRHGVAESLLTLIDGASIDPADDDESLKMQLVDNKKHWLKINDVIDEFAEQAKEKKKLKNAGKESGNDEDEEEDDEDDDDDEEEEDDEDEDEELALSSGGEDSDHSAEAGKSSGDNSVAPSDEDSKCSIKDEVATSPEEAANSPKSSTKNEIESKGCEDETTSAETME